ncbi:MAG TPA: hypothetical protein ENH33_00990 [Actinobacteria bacterium]|nr:hypothetical protein [Actinomycetota bacterium]
MTLLVGGRFGGHFEDPDSRVPEATFQPLGADEGVWVGVAHVWSLLVSQIVVDERQLSGRGVTTPERADGWWRRQEREAMDTPTLG